MPNMKMSIYKNRRGSMNTFFLWIVADKSPCRYDGALATDYHYNLIPIEDLEINVKPGGEYY